MGSLRAAVAELQMVDHHVHGAFCVPMTRARFEESLNEGSPDPIPGWMTQFDSQLGFAIRRWCAPLLGLPEHASADDYWARRARRASRPTMRGTAINLRGLDPLGEQFGRLEAHLLTLGARLR